MGAEPGGGGDLVAVVRPGLQALIYIYICIERERERDIERYIYVLYIYIYIHIYIYIYIYIYREREREGEILVPKAELVRHVGAVVDDVRQAVRILSAPEDVADDLAPTN